MRCVSFYFERSCPEQRPRAALKPQEPHSSGTWTPGAPAEVLASRGVVVVESRQAAGVIFVVCIGKAVLKLHPPLRPLSHNVNPRDGAQDITLTSNKYTTTSWDKRQEPAPQFSALYETSTARYDTRRWHRGDCNLPTIQYTS
jgi:hypothetical protein